jgi:diaminopimelate decarboxylase
VNHFQRRAGQLHAEAIPLATLAREHGTPLYVYSTATLTRHWKVLQGSLRGLDALVCYAVKANSNLAVLSTFARLGAGFDIVSGGELYRVLKAGGRPGQVVFSGVGKRDDELAFALDAGVGTINVESAGELARLSAVARRLKLRAPLALRVNPDVDPKTHPYIATGLRESKFGIPVAEARRLYHLAIQDPHLDVRGVACHIGSQITSLRPFIDAVARVRALASDLAKAGIRLRHLDVGGGLGVTYHREVPPSPGQYGAAIKKALAGWEGQVHLEPGRVLVGNAGILLTRVVQLKKSGRKTFVVVDAAMNDLVRPAFYDAWHEIEPVVAPPRGARAVTCDVVGPVCESGDFLARNRKLVLPAEGDLLCVRTAGAYGFTMASNYNSRPRAAEVLVDGRRALLARERETYIDLVRGEALPSSQPPLPRKRFRGRRG